MTWWTLHDMIIVAAIICSRAASKDASSCGYAEEGKPYRILLKNIAYNINDYYTVTADNTAIATCTEAQDCTLRAFSNVASIEKSIGTYNSKDYMNITISLTYVTRMYSNNVWAVHVKLNGSKPGNEKMDQIGNCTLQVYANTKNIVCNKELNNSRLYIKCVSTRVYPRARCIISETKINDGDAQLKTSVTHTSNPDDHNYFNTECVTSIPVTNIIKNTTYDFQVSMYPNITGNDSDVTFGVNKTFPVSIYAPSIRLTNCPSSYEIKGSEVNCTCENKDNTDSTTNITWYKNGTAVAVDVISSTISLNTSENLTEQEIYCEATNVLGWKSGKLDLLIVYNTTLDVNSSNKSENNNDTTYNCTNKACEIDFGIKNFILYLATTGTAFVFVFLLALFIVVKCSCIKKWKDIKNINNSNLLLVEIDNSDIYMIGEESDSCYTIGTSVYRMLEPYVQHDLVSRMNSSETYMSDDSQACLIADSADASHKNTYPMRRCSRISIEDEPVNHYEYIT